MPENLGRHCREWPQGKTDAEIRVILEENSQPQDLIVYTDGSVTKSQSGWAFTVKQDGKTIHEDSAAYKVTTSSMTMEVEAVTHALQWIATITTDKNTRAVILTDSMNLIQRVNTGMGSPDWHAAMNKLRLQRLLWIYCPGHAGVKGNDRADSLAGKANLKDGLQLERSDILRNPRQILQKQKSRTSTLLIA